MLDQLYNEETISRIKKSYDLSFFLQKYAETLESCEGINDIIANSVRTSAGGLSLLVEVKPENSPNRFVFLYLNCELFECDVRNFLLTEEHIAYLYMESVE